MKPLTVLSLFDGKSCGRIALERAGIPVGRYYASEIDKYAMRVSTSNYPDIMQLGDVCAIHVNGRGYICVGDVECVHCLAIDLFIGGSPCQGFSFAGKNLNFEDPRSRLFFEYLRLLQAVQKWNPNVRFLLENVRMKKVSQRVITDSLGVQPVLINSMVFSPQDRLRTYWTNIPMDRLPQDQGATLHNVVESDAWALTITSRRTEKGREIRRKAMAAGKDYSTWSDREFIAKKSLKANCLTKVTCWKAHSVVLKTAPIEFIRRLYNEGIPLPEAKTSPWLRILTTLEMERLQTLPEGYTRGVSKSQRMQMIGNGWNIDTVAFLFKNISIH